MFELAFSEVLLVLIIALVVIGPERLPEVARGIGKAVGSVKRFIDNVRNETSLQDEIADLRRQLDLSKEAGQLKQLGESIRSDIQSSIDEVDYTAYNRLNPTQMNQQHREAEHNNARAHLEEHHQELSEEELGHIQRPTFGREFYEELPPWYHQQADGAMQPKVPTPPQIPTQEPNSDSAPTDNIATQQTEKTA